MKKIIQNNGVLLWLLAAIFLIFLLHSCKSVKTQVVENQSFTKIDTILIEKEKAVFDTVFVSVPVVKTQKKECDTLCQIALEKALSDLKITQKNGENKAGFYYDLYKKQLVLYQNLAQKENIYKSENQAVTKQKEIIKEIEKKYIPLWFYFFAFLGWFLVFVLAKILYSARSFFM